MILLWLCFIRGMYIPVYMCLLHLIWLAEKHQYSSGVRVDSGGYRILEREI